jgi:hypothetical protein
MEWIKISDRLPIKEIDNQSEGVLVATESKSVWDGYYDYNNDTWRRSYSSEELHNVTHWMRLPEPPKE